MLPLFFLQEHDSARLHHSLEAISLWRIAQQEHSPVSSLKTKYNLFLNLLVVVVV
jgi:hypothetical protein